MNSLAGTLLLATDDKEDRERSTSNAFISFANLMNQNDIFSMYNSLKDDQHGSEAVFNVMLRKHLCKVWLNISKLFSIATYL